MRILTTVALILGLLVGLPTQANEVARIAFVNIPQILEQAPQAGAVRETLDLEFAQRDADLAGADKRLELLKQQLTRDAETLEEEALRKLEREALSLERELKRGHEEYNEDRNIRKNEELAKMQREIRLSIVNLARELGFDLVLESGVMFASERTDITPLVIERLKQDFDKKIDINKPQE